MLNKQTGTRRERQKPLGYRKLANLRGDANAKPFYDSERKSPVSPVGERGDTDYAGRQPPEAGCRIVSGAARIAQAAFLQDL
jgi:hypothetical protein